MERRARLPFYFLVSSTSYFLLSDKDFKLLTNRSISRKLKGYSTASTADAAYIIGGDFSRDVIAEFRNNVWRQLGSLVQGRDSHASISFNGETMIIGGWSDGRLIIINSILNRIEK